MGIRIVYRGKGMWVRIALAALAAAVFCLMGAALLLMVLPKPHGRLHYLAAGTAPAVAGLLALLARTEREKAQTRMRRVVRGQSRAEA